jgi:hypothetical protein
VFYFVPPSVDGLPPPPRGGVAADGRLSVDSLAEIKRKIGTHVSIFKVAGHQARTALNGRTAKTTSEIPLGIISLASIL